MIGLDICSGTCLFVIYFWCLFVVEIEACFAHCVRSRLFVSSSTFELVLGRLAHFCAPAAELYRVCNEIMTVQQTNSSAQTVKISRSATGVYEKTEDFKKRLHQFKSRYLAQHRKLRCNTTALRVLWVRIALVEKLLGELVDVILKNVKYTFHSYPVHRTNFILICFWFNYFSHFYEEGALLAHAVDGPIFANLLGISIIIMYVAIADHVMLTAGPNVLDFSKIKTSEHLRSDPPAPELIDKQRFVIFCVSFVCQSAYFPMSLRLGIVSICLTIVVSCIVPCFLG